MRNDRTVDSLFKYKKKIKISLEEYGQLVYVWRGSSPKKIQEFSISYRTEIDGKWYTIRRHCWTLHQDQFHTHVRIGLGKNRFKKIYPPKMHGTIVRALNWAKEDVMLNWYSYLQFFKKIAKNNHEQK